MIKPPPLSLYIHFPWCIKKCPYCDFNSHQVGTVLDQNGYIDALLADLDFELGAADFDRPIHSIFMGGGTPSLFGPDAMHNLLEAITERLKFTPDIEITMEANPGTTEFHDIDKYRLAGINRLSIGVQSFNQQQLTTLGRIHSPENARQALEKAKAGGFTNINIDLMFGLPGQTTTSALADLESGIALDPAHISLYQLTIEPNTVFYRYPPQLPNQDVIMKTQQALQSRLSEMEFRQYEISAYCQPDMQSRHNLNYWQFGDYIGIGAGAHGKITENNLVTRRARKKHPATYLLAAGSASAIAESRVVDNQEILLEYVMNALRLTAGFDISMAESRTGISSQSIRDTLKDFVSRGLLVESNNQIMCSDRGYLFIDDILQQLL